MKKSILLDMDGVLVRFIAGVFSLYGLREEEVEWPLGVYDLNQVLGKNFWSDVHAAGEDFWAKLPKYDHADELWDLCLSYAPTFICTSPSFKPACLAGKLRWLQNWQGQHFRDFVITPHKYLFTNHVLINDSDDNVNQFVAAGGTAITFPAKTNALHAKRHHPLQYVREQMDAINC